MARIFRFLRASSLLYAVVIAGCGPLSSRVIADRAELDQAYRKSHETKAAVDKIAQPLIDSGNNVGIVVGVLDEDGNKRVYGYGRKSIDSAAAPDGRSIFAVGSVTKAFVAALLYHLIEDGSVRSDDTVESIMGSAADFSESARRITLDQLVSQSSGLPRQPNDLKMVASLINYSFTGENIYRHINKDELYGFLKTFKLGRGEIGKHQYSNIGMGLLGHLLEVKTGKPLPSLLRDKIFIPLGLEDTTYVLDDEQRARLATGHVGDSPFFMRRNAPMALWETEDIMKGAAGLYTTANDLLKFAQYRVGMPDLPAVKRAVNSPGIFGLGHERFESVSLGWSVDEFEDAKTVIIYKHGMIGGYTGYIGIEKRKRLAVVVLCNNFDWDDRVGHNLLLTLSRNVRTAVAPPGPTP